MDQKHARVGRVLVDDILEEDRPLLGGGVGAERLADRVIVTSDNPRSEVPGAITDDILAGLEAPERAVVILDRREAIRVAIQQAKPNDVVMVAGKGHETYQILGSETIHFDDRDECRKAIASCFQ